VVEAAVMAALDKPAAEISHDDYLEIFTDLDLKPRILYPIKGLKQINPLRLCDPPPVAAVLQQTSSPWSWCRSSPRRR
jgi:hypothetical protein